MEILAPSLFGTIAIIHLIGLISKTQRVKTYTPPTSDSIPSISLIVCAHNEFENLKIVLPCLAHQDYSNFEIIIVLDRCDDQSNEFKQDYQEIKWIEILEVPDHWNPKKYAISRAIEAATNDWILLTDADCRPKASWISEMAKLMTEKTDVVLGISPYQRRLGFLNELIHFETFQTALEFTSKTIAGKPYMGLGRNLAYRKAAFMNVGGFKNIESITGGDDDLLIQKMSDRNFNIALSEAAHVESIPKTNWSEYLGQKTRHYSVGKSYSAQSQLSETVRWTLQFLFWVLFAISMVWSPTVTLMIFVGSFVIRILSINIVAHRLGKRFKHLWLPFVDLVYSVVLPVISLRSLLVKNVKWK